jgi:hypothetical protein
MMHNAAISLFGAAEVLDLMATILISALLILQLRP